MLRELFERLRATMNEESPIDLDEHAELITSEVSRSTARDHPDVQVNLLGERGTSDSARSLADGGQCHGSQ